MDFVILKINGRDVTNSSHEDTVRFFESAQEPITIQVLRMQKQCKSDQSMMPKIQTLPEATKSTFISTAVQTDLAGFVNEDYIDNYYVFEDGVDYEDEDEEDDDDDDEEEVEFDEILSNPNESHRVDNYKLGEDVYLEEVTLCKSSSTEKLGLTVSYNYAPDRDNSEAAEIYISEIARDSLTARDGRLREGDQILRVNGRDIESKEQTEKVFAQTKNTVTLLVSRCLNQNSPPISPDNIPAYQNSMIEILMRHQQRQFESSGVDAISEHLENSPWLLRTSTPPPVPSHNIVVPPVTASVITTSSSTCSSQNSYSSNKDTIKSQIALPLDRKHSLIENLKESTKKLDDLSIRNKSIMLTRAINTVSDTEHIYETIPESDSEPIYSSPYESQFCFNRINEPTQSGNRSKSSKSNSSIEEKDSSSAYNTGESCNSNPLVLELHRADRDHRGSTLVLCPPGNIAGPTTPTNCRIKPPDGAARLIHPSIPTSQSRNLIISEDKKSSTTHHHHHHHRHCQPPQLPQQQQQLYHYHNRLSQNSLPDNRDRASSMNAEIMYTNVDNLERTMILQQEIFTQALNRKNITNREGRVKNSKSQGKFRAPNLTQYHFIGSQQVRASTTLNTPEDKCDPRMEWKVKRRPDGTRYIARRSVRNRLLGNRTLEISEERAGQTTEDDTVSEIKLGRYWSKDERKRHIEHARQRKQRHQSSLQHQHCKLRQCREYTNCDQLEEDTKELLSKKLVPDTLTHTNRTDEVNCGTNGKPIGLLSVTTV